MDEIKTALVKLEPGEVYTAGEDGAHVIEERHTHGDIIRYVIADIGPDDVREMVQRTMQDNDRAFPAAADGRELTPMAAELYAAGADFETASFVAGMLHQSGWEIVRRPVACTADGLDWEEIPTGGRHEAALREIQTLGMGEATPRSQSPAEWEVYYRQLWHRATAIATQATLASVRK